MTNQRKGTADDFLVGWHPIATAPRDGTRVICCGAELMPAECEYRPERPGFRESEGWYRSNQSPQVYPFAWMPLPPRIYTEPSTDSGNQPADAEPSDSTRRSAAPNTNLHSETEPASSAQSAAHKTDSQTETVTSLGVHIPPLSGTPDEIAPKLKQVAKDFIQAERRSNADVDHR